AVYSFFHLLVFGSLIGFVAYNWLLGHVSVALVGTYAYVNPVVAILAGWLINNEAITLWIVSGMAVILAGVALVRGGTIDNSAKVEMLGNQQEASDEQIEIQAGLQIAPA